MSEWDEIREKVMKERAEARAKEAREKGDDRQTIHNALDVMEKTFNFSLFIDVIDQRYAEILESRG